MIEQMVLVENADCMLAWTDHTGELHWLLGGEEAMRYVYESMRNEGSEHYRISLDGGMIHESASNQNYGGKDYRRHMSALFAAMNSKNGTQVKWVKRFVENLKKERTSA